MRRLVVIGLLALACLVAFLLLGREAWEPVEVPEVRQPAVLRLTNRSSDFLGLGTNGVSVWVTGSLDGEAEGWPRQRLQGTVNWRIYHDWFQPDCELHCAPLSVRGGQLTVRYQFH